ncbi:MAG: zinc protease [Abditibacteriota bacterium]|nr:zinc protease [Abditibacteriota bacterium]
MNLFSHPFSISATRCGLTLSSAIVLAVGVQAAPATTTPQSAPPKASPSQAPSKLIRRKPAQPNVAPTAPRATPTLPTPPRLVPPRVVPPRVVPPRAAPPRPAPSKPLPPRPVPPRPDAPKPGPHKPSPQPTPRPEPVPSKAQAPKTTPVKAAPTKAAPTKAAPAKSAPATTAPVVASGLTADGKWVPSPLFARASLSLKTLPNGVRGVVRETRGTGLVCVQVWVRAGSRFESEASSGAAHIVETLALRASKNYPRGVTDIGGGAADAIENLGGAVGSLTSRDSTFYSATVDARFLAQALAALSDATLRPHLTSTSVEEGKLEVESSLQRRETDPLLAVVDLSYRATFARHPYRKPAGGTSLGISNLTPERVRQFHNRFYVGRNISVIVVGDVQASGAHALVSKYFGSAAKASGAVPAIPSEKSPSSYKVIERKRPINRAAVALSFRAPGVKSVSDVIAMDVLLAHWREGRDAVLRRVLLGPDKSAEGDNAASEVPTAAPLALGFDVDYLTQRDPSLFIISLVVEPEDRAAAIEATLGEISKIQNQGISEASLARAKRVLSQQYIGQGETVSGQAGALGFYEMIDDYQFAVNYLDRIARVTPADIKRVATIYLSRTAYTQAVIAPAPRERAPDTGSGTITASLPAGELASGR